MSDDESVHSEAAAEVVDEYAGLSIAKQRKWKYAAALKKAFATYKRCLIINVDNVGSNHLQRVRKELRGTAEILMGKNTVIRKILREHDDPKVKNIYDSDLINGNIGFVFTDGDLSAMKDILIAVKVPASAKVGMIAPTKVVMPAGPTGMDPGQTSFFQAMNIATKITRGCIEIVTPVTLCQEGERVSSTAVALLSKMEMRPFFFGIDVQHCYDDGQIFDAKVLDMTNADLTNLFFKGVSNVAAISLAINFPTLASVPHSVVNAFRNLLFISIGTEYTFAESKQYKDILADPEALAKAQAATAAAASSGAPAAAAAADESEEEDDDDDDDGDDDDFDLFG